MSSNKKKSKQKLSFENKGEADIRRFLSPHVESKSLYTSHIRERTVLVDCDPINFSGKVFKELHNFE